MSRITSKFIVVLLLPVFLMVTTGGALSNAWCLGSDGHVEIEALAVNGCSDGNVENGKVSSSATPSLHQTNDEHSGSGLDFSVHVQQAEETFLKRFTPPLFVSIDSVTPNDFSSIVAQNIKLAVGHLMSKPPPRTSQTILAHRTTVLLV